MKRPRRFPMLPLLTVLVVVPGPVLGGESQPRSTRYVEAVRDFADTVLERGRDRFGPQKTPLFVDGLHAETLEPYQKKRADSRTCDHLVFYGP